MEIVKIKEIDNIEIFKAEVSGISLHLTRNKTNGNVCTSIDDPKYSTEIIALMITVVFAENPPSLFRVLAYQYLKQIYGNF